MRPRVLFTFTWMWTAATGGRFTAPFLEHEALLEDTYTGIIIGMQLGLIVLLSSPAGMAADYIESKAKHVGRLAVLSVGVVIGTTAMLLHYFCKRYFIELFRENDPEQVMNVSSKSQLIAVTFAIRFMYSIGFAMIEPVIDGLTLAYLEEFGYAKADFGKERLYGALGWAISNMILGICIDRWGFESMYILSVAFAITTLCSMIVFYRQISQSKGSTNMATSSSDSLLQEEEIDSLHSTTHTDNLTNGNHAIKKEDQQFLGSVASLLNILCRTPVGIGFLFAYLALSMGGSVVENLIFLFYETMNANYTFCGFSVIITVLFEFPLFYYSPQLLGYYGPPKLMQIALLSYFVRVVGYTFVPQNMFGLLLIFESLHGMSYASYKSSGVEFVAQNCPTGYEATGQGLLNAIRGCGSLFGLSIAGWAQQTFGPRAMYRGFGAIAATGSLVLFLAEFWGNRKSDENGRGCCIGDGQQPQQEENESGSLIRTSNKETIQYQTFDDWRSPKKSIGILL